MPKDTKPGEPTTRRYSPEEKAAAVRMVRAMRAELGSDHGTVQRVATQLGYGTESVRSWVAQPDIDEGHTVGISTSDAARMKALEQETGLRGAEGLEGRPPRWPGHRPGPGRPAHVGRRDRWGAAHQTRPNDEGGPGHCRFAAN